MSYFCVTSYTYILLLFYELFKSKFAYSVLTVDFDVLLHNYAHDFTTFLCV